MHYCGVVAVRGALQLAMLEEVRTEEPPIRLNALFYEPGSAAEVAHELHTLGEVVIGVGALLAGPVNGRPGRDCDALLLRRGVAPQAPTQETRILADLLRDLAAFAPGGEDRTGPAHDRGEEHRLAGQQVELAEKPAWPVNRDDAIGTSVVLDRRDGA